MISFPFDEFGSDCLNTSMMKSFTSSAFFASRSAWRVWRTVAATPPAIDTATSAAAATPTRWRRTKRDVR